MPGSPLPATHPHNPSPSGSHSLGQPEQLLGFPSVIKLLLVVVEEVLTFPLTAAASVGDGGGSGNTRRTFCEMTRKKSPC